MIFFLRNQQFLWFFFAQKSENPRDQIYFFNFLISGDIYTSNSEEIFGVPCHDPWRSFLRPVRSLRSFIRKKRDHPKFCSTLVHWHIGWLNYHQTSPHHCIYLKKCIEWLYKIRHLKITMIWSVWNTKINGIWHAQCSLFLFTLRCS